MCRELAESGAKLFVSDVNAEALKTLANEYHAIVVAPNDIYSQDVDVYSPCALGATVNDVTIPLLKCSIIACAANNQLHNIEKHGKELQSEVFCMLLITRSMLVA